MEKNNFKETISALLENVDHYFTTKTVVGEAIHINDTIVVPLVDVSFGIGAGSMAQEKKNNGGGGVGAKMTPSALLVITNGTTRLVNVKQQDSVTKILDMVPDIIDKFKKDDTENTEKKQTASSEED